MSSKFNPMRGPTHGCRPNECFFRGNSQLPWALSGHTHFRVVQVPPKGTYFKSCLTSYMKFCKLRLFFTEYYDKRTLQAWAVNSVWPSTNVIIISLTRLYFCTKWGGLGAYENFPFKTFYLWGRTKGVFKDIW